MAGGPPPVDHSAALARADRTRRLPPHEIALAVTGKCPADGQDAQFRGDPGKLRSEEHTSELQSRLHLVCRLLLEKKNRLSHLGAGHQPRQWTAPILKTPRETCRRR